MDFVSSTPLIDVGAGALAVATFVQLTKFILNLIVKPTNPNQNSIVRLYVYLVAIGLVVGLAFLRGGVTGVDASPILALSFSIGSTALLVYHLLTGLDQPTPLP